MRTSRLASIWLIAFWAAVFAAFASWSRHADGFVIYSLLVLLVGLRRSYLIRPGYERSVVGALAFGAALNFGPIGGGIIGGIAGLTYYAGAGEDRRSRAMAGFASGISAGLVAGIVYVGLWHWSPSAYPVVQTALALPAAVACLISITAVDLIDRRCYIYHSFWQRIKAATPLSLEFVAGVVLAVGIFAIEAVQASGLVLVIMPVVYLARQSIGELLVSTRQNDDDIGLSTIRSLVAAIDARDRFTCAHNTNVTNLAVRIAERMDLSSAEIDGIRMAALLHDIGKLWVPEHILLKPGRLSPDQFETMKNHTELGQKILDGVQFPWPVPQIVRGHHERWDGTGYPDGLKGEQIPVGARILCLADVYDAMISKRSYRSGKSVEQAIRYIRDSAGTHFDPAAVRAFEQVILAGDLEGVDPTVISDNYKPIPVKTNRPLGKANAMDSAVEDISSTSSEFIAMLEIAQAANTSLNLDRILNLLAGKIKDMISCSSCLILLHEQNPDRLQVKLAIGANAEYFEDGYVALDRQNGYSAMVFQSGKGIMTVYGKNDLILPVLRRPWARIDDWVELRGAMVLPLISGDSIIGTVNLYHAKQNGFTKDDFRLLAAVIPQVSKAIQNALLFKQTTESAMTDPLTGIHNARYLFMRLEQELDRAKALNRPLSILGMDLDNFKDINDTFGHQHGDAVLRDLAKVFVSQVREYDVVCRYAGDEFVIILPHTTREEAIETAKRIQSAVDARKPYGNGDQTIRVGVSIGVATFPEDGNDIRTLAERADAHMYAEKKRRKDEQEAA